MKIDWLLLARDLAAHLRAARDQAVIQRTLDEAAQDAASLGAPPDWWDIVAREYQAGIRPDSEQDWRDVRQKILEKAQR
jgi:hypothetical protein